MLQRATKKVDRKAIDEFKREADALPATVIEEDPKRKITHWIKLDNWKKLKKLSTELSTRTDERVTINMLLDMAVEMFFKSMEEDKIEDKR